MIVLLASANHKPESRLFFQELSDKLSVYYISGCLNAVLQFIPDKSSIFYTVKIFT